MNPRRRRHQRMRRKREKNRAAIDGLLKFIDRKAPWLKSLAGYR